MFSRLSGDFRLILKRMTKQQALVTGASGGLGAEISRNLAVDHHVLMGGRDLAALNALSDEMLSATPWPVDLTDHDALAQACARIDRLDVLVHNAGYAELGSVEQSSAEQWRTTMEINVIAVVELTRLLLPALRAAKGHVVLINSGAGIRANPGWGSYAASKFALRAFGDALRQEESTLRVTSVHPGRIDTPMQRGIVAAEGNEYEPHRYLSPETVAQAVGNAVRTPLDAHPTEIMLRPNRPTLSP